MEQRVLERRVMTSAGLRVRLLRSSQVALVTPSQRART